jgi:hypothetical protein
VEETLFYISLATEEENEDDLLFDLLVTECNVKALFSLPLNLNTDGWDIF